MPARRRLAAALALVAAGVPLAARAERWIVLGRREVNLGADHDEIPVTSERGKFRAIKLRVRERGVQFAHMTVIFGNGRRFEVLLRDFIPAGGESRIVDLPGSDRTVNRVILRYTTRPGSAERAEVVLWGLQD
ncbi:MAG: hypothetical protein J0L91_07205 [Burkholderiales bacterium]|nr:hypothetical protein [Burkholderiales bacterium]MCC7114223.1 hypothetical protein [Burkholderiales bacterium]